MYRNKLISRRTILSDPCDDKLFGDFHDMTALLYKVTVMTGAEVHGDSLRR